MGSKRRAEQQRKNVDHLIVHPGLIGLKQFGRNGAALQAVGSKGAQQNTQRTQPGRGLQNLALYTFSYIHALCRDYTERHSP